MYVQYSRRCSWGHVYMLIYISICMLTYAVVTDTYMLTYADNILAGVPADTCGARCC